MSQQPPSQGSNIVVMSDSPEPNILLRVVWFVFVGWWFSFWAIVLATVLQLTIIGIPCAIWVINRIPQIMTLKSSRRLQVSNNDFGVTVIGYSDREQRRLWVRAIYYVLVGWWATFVGLLLLWIAGILIITLPISFWMAGQTGKVQTLRR